MFPDTAFLFCGSRAVEHEDLNRLDLWRAYGDNGNGIAITTILSKTGLKEDQLDLLEVEYIDSENLGSLKEEYDELQNKIDAAIIAKHTKEAEELHEKRMKIEVGYKLSDYKSEDEVRIVYYAGDSSNVVPEILHYSAESGRLRTYVERKIRVGDGQTISGLYVTIGPRVPEYEASHWKSMVDWTVRQLGLSGTRTTEQSKLIYVG